jgi:hypothetical protein
MRVPQLVDPLALASQIEIVEAALLRVALQGKDWVGVRVGGSAAGLKINVKISLRLDLGMPTLPRRTREGWGNRRRKGDLRR